MIGAHMSVAGGPATGIERALAVRARALQIFTKNASQWKGKPITDEEAAAFRAAWAASGLAPVVAHDSYLINLATPDRALRKQSVEALADELLRCELLGVAFLVAHPGAHVGSGVLEGCDRVSESINEARALAPAPDVILLLETVAGQGTTLGRKFEELARMRSGVARRDLVQFCLDTCHVHAAGYDLTTDQGYEETFREFDAILGLESLRAFHVNDSKNERGSHVDRHEHIGKGKIGLAAFARLMRDPRFTAVPKILETPKGADGVVMDRRNLALLRSLAEPPGGTTNEPRRAAH
ncbi:MAG TPA: deoxyribonuclease IV [Candidatus Eisenbacteria bacterium]|nr:deoxyribonuclease IV [Candidatus Eisenbacteria bacterium]